LISILLAAAILGCWAAMIAASVKLRRFRKATKQRDGWQFERTALVWSRTGNFAWATGVMLLVPLGIIGPTELAGIGLVGLLILIVVFISAAKEAAGQGEGAN